MHETEQTACLHVSRLASFSTRLLTLPSHFKGRDEEGKKR